MKRRLPLLITSLIVLVFAILLMVVFLSDRYSRDPTSEDFDRESTFSEIGVQLKGNIIAPGPLKLG